MTSANYLPVLGTLPMMANSITLAWLVPTPLLVHLILAQSKGAIGRHARSDMSLIRKCPSAAPSSMQSNGCLATLLPKCSAHQQTKTYPFIASEVSNGIC